MKSRAEKPLSIVVAYTAGGTTDTIARIIGARLQEKLGRAVIIENKAGATGQIGSRFVARAEPDGLTIQIATQTTHAVAPSLYAKWTTIRSRTSRRSSWRPGRRWCW